MGNVMTYCCVDMSARDYSKIGLLFSRNGVWNDEQLISKKFIDETFRVVGRLRADLQITKGIILFIGGYLNMMKNQKYLIQVVNLVNIHLLIEKMIL